MQTDAVVNPTHPGFSAPESRDEKDWSDRYGGTEKALLLAGGEELLLAREALGALTVGEAKATDGYLLPARYVIHTAGPVWRGGFFGEEKLLFSAFESALTLAAELEARSVALPLISSGRFGFPKRKALKIAREAALSFLDTHEMDVFLVVYDRESYEISKQLEKKITSFLSEETTQETFDEAPARRKPRVFSDRRKNSLDPDFMAAPQMAAEAASFHSAKKQSLDEFLKERDESFSEMLLRKIDEAGITDAECYKRANIDRKLFSKIRNSPDYRPKKSTVIAFAISLRLSYEETEEMLKKAGFALSHASRFDLIIEYFIREGRYDIYTINECLFAFDQPLLGA